MITKQKTLVIIKPDGIQKNIIGEIISRIEKKGLKILNMKMMKLSRELAEKLYEEHRNKPFFKSLVNFITYAPIIVIIVEGEDVISIFRSMMGSTDPKNAAPGTIRGDYGTDIERNIIHGSDSIESAKREVDLFFPEEQERVI
ncbi:MAG: nucleoside-diphosphate kinase [Actinomycetia bacterium]|nr:nucleoside-diphosphate kinase [Actinomycetes bacterium]